MADLATAVNGAFAFAHQPADLDTVLGPPSACFRIPATRDVLDYAEKVETQEELTEVLRRVAPTVGGRTTRPWSMPGTRMLCT